MTSTNPGRCDTGGCIVPTRHGGHIQFTSDRNEHGQLRGYATLAEWVAFVAGVKAGEFDDLVAGDE